MVRKIGFGEGSKAPARSVWRTGDPRMLPRLGGGARPDRAGAADIPEPASTANARPPQAGTPVPDATALPPDAPGAADPTRPRVQMSRLPVTGPTRAEIARAAREAEPDPRLTGSRRARVFGVLLLVSLGALTAFLVAAVFSTPVRGVPRGLGGLLVVILCVEVFILRWLLRRWVGRR